MNSSKQDRFCPHIEESKIYTWKRQSFSEKYDTEYQYCYCKICKQTDYTGMCRFVEVNLNRISSAKEQDMNNKNVSVSKKLKALHAKSNRQLSLKEFVRRMASAGEQIARDWFDNKSGVLNETRSDKNKASAKAANVATRTEKRKKGAKAVAPKADK